MELSFPFRNLTFNNFIDFWSSDVIRDFFIEIKQDDDPNTREFLKNKINHWNSWFSSHQNELNQIINTSNQATIDSYFEFLKSDLEYVSSLNREFFLTQVRLFNTQSIEKYNSEVASASEKYFDGEDIQKHEHLEEYEKEVFVGSLFGVPWGEGAKFEKKKFTNYKYFCIEDPPALANLDHFEAFHQLIKRLTQDYSEFLSEYISKYDADEIQATITDFFDKKKVILHVEGTTDEKYIKRAAELLDRQAVLEKVEFVDVGGSDEMDNVWRFYSNHAVDVIPTKRVFLYDCDITKPDEDNGFIVRRVIPQQEEHPITKGIENLFTKETLQKVEAHDPKMIDTRVINKRIRGEENTEEIWSVNRNEKTNMCNWLIENGASEDFTCFNIIFDILENAVNS